MAVVTNLKKLVVVFPVVGGPTLVKEGEKVWWCFTKEGEIGGGVGS